MKRKLYWGLGALAVLFIGVSLVLLVSTTDKFDIPEPIENYINPGELDISHPNFSSWMINMKEPLRMRWQQTDY